MTVYTLQATGDCNVIEQCQSWALAAAKRETIKRKYGHVTVIIWLSKLVDLSEQ